MITQELFDKLTDATSHDRIYLDANMSERTSFKTGGPAECVVCPSESSEIIEILKLAKEYDQAVLVVGNGTNILVRDGGIEGITISLYEHYNKVDIDEEKATINAMSGALLSAISNYACRAGLSGLEFAGGIPGSVGGAIKMNAGAHEGAIGDVLVDVTIIHSDMSVKTYVKDEMQFEYRKSIVKDSDIVLEANFQLTTGLPTKIRHKMVGFSKKRKASQPLNMASAGSSYRRPEGMFPGELIEKAGLKGFTIGGAQVSKKHAGFIVNTGKANSKEIEEVLQYVEDKVLEESGVVLEREIIIIGKDEE